MADIYIIYAKEDRKIAEKLHELLSEQWSLWWDDDIVNEWDEDIESELGKSKCVVPLYSKSLRAKSIVKAELDLAKSLNKPVLPIRLDMSNPPLLGRHSHIEFQEWNGDVDFVGFKQLKKRIARIVPPKEDPKRPDYILQNKIQPPSLFFSVSSYNTQFNPYHAVSILRLFQAPAILVSAYDIVRGDAGYRKSMIDELKKYNEEGGFILVDSGNYEASRLDDKTWNPEELKTALSKIPHDWVFCFDDMEPKIETCVSGIIQSVERDKEFTAGVVLPIVHAPKSKDRYMLESLPKIIFDISKKLEPPLIAVPERELGEGVVTRAKTIMKIRKELNKLPYYQPIHILGTNNPWNIPIFSAAGADTFDGLEWCRMVVDRDTNRLHHFHHFDFFMHQNGKIESPVARTFLDDDNFPYDGKVAFHNLDYYTAYMNDLRTYFEENNEEAYMIHILESDNAKRLKKQFPDIFK